MVDLDWKTKMMSSEIQCISPRLANKLHISIPPPKLRPADISPASDSSCSAYEHYLRLPELRKLFESRDFPQWKSEPVFKPALTALELTFRFISTVLSDPRPYANRREWKRRLAALATSQIQIVAMLCEEEENDSSSRGAVPIVDLTSSDGVLARENSSAEVWRMSGNDTVVVSKISEESLLPRLATWPEFEEVVRKVQYSIECEMLVFPYTLGLGEPNLGGKPSLDYDRICRPADLHKLNKCRNDDVSRSNGHENQALYTVYQILESWIRVADRLLNRIGSEIESQRFDNASSQCWILQKVWNLLTEIEDLHLLMDPNDFLRLRNQLGIKASTESELFCFRSRALVAITRLSKDLRHKVPEILGVEVDPTGGPRLQNAAMSLYRRKEDGEECGAKVHLLQAMQAVEAAVKEFYFGYKQVLGVVMGSLEAKLGDEVLSQVFMEPTYFPSLDAAKTFLGERRRNV